MRLDVAVQRPDCFGDEPVNVLQVLGQIVERLSNSRNVGAAGDGRTVECHRVCPSVDGFDSGSEAEVSRSPEDNKSSRNKSGGAGHGHRRTAGSDRRRGADLLRDERFFSRVPEPVAGLKHIPAGVNYRRPDCTMLSVLGPATRSCENVIDYILGCVHSLGLL